MRESRTLRELRSRLEWWGKFYRESLGGSCARDTNEARRLCIQVEGWVHGAVSFARQLLSHREAMRVDEVEKLAIDALRHDQEVAACWMEAHAALQSWS